MEGDINMSFNTDRVNINYIRQREDELRLNWKDQKNIKQNILEVFFQYPIERRALNLNRDMEGVYARQLQSAVDFQDIAIKRNDLIVNDKKTFSVTVSLYYGAVSKSIVNVKVIDKAEQIARKFAPYFSVVKLRYVTQFVDGTFASTGGKQIRGVAGGKPKLRD
jgi:hypothetical protein